MSYKASRIQRVANLDMDEHGSVTGRVKLTFMGSPALRWRQASLEGDAASLEHELQSAAEQMLPRELVIKVGKIEKLDDYEEPLTVNYDVSGGIGSATGKRLLVPGDLFETNSKMTFPHEKRAIGVYFEYPHLVQDAVKINFPKNLAIESQPTDAQLQFKNFAAYQLSSTSTATSFIVRRNYSLGEIIFEPTEYPELRTFYNQFESKDQQTVVLKFSGEAAGAPGGAAMVN